MTNDKASHHIIQKIAKDRELVRELQKVQHESSSVGKKVILHKYVKQVQPAYKFYKVHAEIAKVLQKVIDDELNRVIIQVPPRIGKSYLASKLFPAAYLTEHPDRNVGVISYSAELAESFSRAAREHYSESGGSLNQYKKAVNDWGTQGGGGLWCAGVGGVVTGRSGHLLIIDDPVKNREDADSATMMEKLWEFYTSTLYTRLEPKVGAIVCIQTRWSDNDLIGRLIEREKNVNEVGRENWVILDLPALFEDLDSRPVMPEHCEVITDWRTEIDEAVCPQRYTTQDYYRIREAVGAREFAALFQQRPAPEGGNLFDHKWWQYYETMDDIPELQRVMLSVDCSFSDSDTSDYVVGTVIGQSGSSFYVLDLFRKRTDIIGTIAMIGTLRCKEGIYNADGVIIELAANGFAVYQMLSRKIPGMIGFKPDKSKVARASAIVPTVEAGNVFLPKNAIWLDQFINEFNLFPASKNDDMVDSLSMGIDYLSRRGASVIQQVNWGRGSPILPSADYG